MNSNIKFYWILMLSIGVLFQSYAQRDNTPSSEPRFEISTQGAYLFYGDLSHLYETTLSLDMRYTFKHQKRFDHFLNAGITTDIGTKGANYYGFHAGIGTKYQCLQLWNKPMYLIGSLEGLYTHETFSTQLIDTTINSTNSEFGFKAQLGIGYKLTPQFSIEIQTNQLSSLGTSAGLGISYSF